MSVARKAIFAHRRNEDGSYDSICPNCFLTAACARSEGELKALEKKHVCHSALLAERGMLVPRISSS